MTDGALNWNWQWKGTGFHMERGGIVNDMDRRDAKRLLLDSTRKRFFDVCTVYIQTTFMLFIFCFDRITSLPLTRFTTDPDGALHNILTKQFVVNIDIYIYIFDFISIQFNRINPIPPFPC